jgi:hypothetical protein
MAAIFLPQQCQRHAAPAQLRVDVPPFRQRLLSRRIVTSRREQLAFQRGIVEPVRDRPGDADHRGTTDIFRHRRATDPDRTERSPARSPRRHTSGAQNFSNLPHRQSLGGHQTSLCESQRDDLARLRLPTTFPESPHQQGGRLPSESVAALPRLPQSICGIQSEDYSRTLLIRGYCALASSDSTMRMIGRIYQVRKDAPS